MTSVKSGLHTIKKVTGYIIPFLLTGFFLYFAFKDVDISEAFHLISQISIPFLIIFLIVFALSHYIRAVRWKVMASSVKEDLSITNSLGATMIGYGVNCVVPRLGELYRGLFLARWEGISRTSMLGTIVVERIIDIIALGIAVLISVLVYSGDLYTEISWLGSALVFGTLGIVALIVILYFTVKLKEKFYDVIVKFIGKISITAGEKTANAFHTLTEGFAALRTPQSYIYTFILSIFIMLAYGYASYIAFYMLHMNEIQSTTFSMAWILMTISAFGIVIPTPGGTGSYHAINIFVLTQLFGFNQEVSAAYAILTHLISYFVFILSTIFFLYYINLRQARKGGKKETFLSVLTNSKDN